MSSHDEHTDAWHSHEGEAPAQDTHGETKPSTIALVGIVGLVVIILTVVILVGYFDAVNRQEKYVKHELADVRGEARATIAQWQSELSSYGWVDAENGIVRMPIDQAMQTIAEEYSAGQ